MRQGTDWPPTGGERHAKIL